MAQQPIQDGRRQNRIADYADPVIVTLLADEQTFRDWLLSLLHICFCISMHLNKDYLFLIDRFCELFSRAKSGTSIS
jgi:hypothetical protein